MAINKKLIHFKTKQKFNEELANGNILETSIVFISDTQEIYTHGTFYDGKQVDLSNIEISIQNILNNKQDNISDLDAIRSGAALGATSVQPSDLANIAKTGSYDDLINKPTIPSAVTESTVSGWGFTKNTGTYSKPSGGIPKTDLASAVQTSLNKADTALQSYTEQYKGTVTGVKINGTTKSPSSGVVDLGTVITSHQTLKTINGESIVGEGDLSIQSANIVTLNIGSLPTQNSSVTVNLTEEQLIMLKSYDTVIKLTFNYLNKPHICTMFHTINAVTHVYSGVAYTVKNSVNYDTTRRYVYGQFSSSVSNTITFTISDIIVTENDVKTINGQSLIGSGDIVIEGGSSGGGAYAEVNHGTSDTTFTLTPNTFHVWDEVASLDLSFADEQTGVANEYLFQFTSGSTATTLTLPDGLKWTNDDAPTISENMIYQISILKGLASVLEFSNPKIVILIEFSIAGTTYQAEEGMTWTQWVDTIYNTGYWQVYGNKIKNPYDGTTVKNVTATDTIISGNSYNV